MYYVQINDGDFVRYHSEKEAIKSVKSVEGFWKIYSDEELKTQLHKIMKALEL